MKKLKAFTLVELLVVISIIALLLSILMPALGRVKEQARSVVCRTNLKSITLAAMLWSEDNDNWTPPHSWAWANPKGADESHGFAGYPNPGSLESYTATDRDKSKNLYACPSAKGVEFFNAPDMTGASRDVEDKEKKCTYGINAWLAIVGDIQKNSPGDRSELGRETFWFYGPGSVHYDIRGVTKVHNIRKSNETVFFMDHENELVAQWNFDPFKAPNLLPQKTQTRWHKAVSRNEEYPDYGSANIAWVDGHVSKEPKDFNSKNKKGDPRWTYYFWDH